MNNLDLRQAGFAGKSWSHWLNLFALVCVCGSLVEAFYSQIFQNEMPCPLCLLQRVALMMAGIGMMLNVRDGPSSVHYAMILASAMGGVLTSGRQILLHIAPGDKGYGSTLWGLHFYSWGFAAFVVMMVFCAVMLCIDRNHMKLARVAVLGGLSALVVWVFFALAAANTISTIMVCKFGACPENPTEYLWKL